MTVAPDDLPNGSEPRTIKTRVAQMIGDYCKVLRFYSRLPTPVLSFETEPHALPDFTRATWAIPLVGATIGACGAGMGLLAYWAGLSTALAAAITIATLVIITGAFHEDGLADSCDGLWGGATRERRLEIMKDSRIGTFGAAGLMLSLVLRIFAVTELFRLVGPMALVLVIGISAASRPLALIPILALPPAQGTGLAASVPMPATGALILACLGGLALLAGGAFLLQLLPGLGVSLVILTLVLMGAIRIARTKIGGHTGDILGACQQLAEITLLIGLSAAATWHGPM